MDGGKASSKNTQQVGPITICPQIARSKPTTKCTPAKDVRLNVSSQATLLAHKGVSNPSCCWTFRLQTFVGRPQEQFIFCLEENQNISTTIAPLCSKIK